MIVGLGQGKHTTAWSISGRKEQRKEGEAGVGREFSILKDGACQKGTGVNLKGLPVSKAGTISATK